MPRPRKDGKPAAKAIRIGRERPKPGGGSFRVRAYLPTSGNPYGKVTYYDAGHPKGTSRKAAGQSWSSAGNSHRPGTQTGPSATAEESTPTDLTDLQSGPPQQT